MEQLLTPKFLILYAFVASAAFVHFRGRDRHKFLRQLTDHSTFMAPVNCLMYLFSAVPNRPILDVEQFPELRPLREEWNVLRDEALALYQSGHVRASAEHDDVGFQTLFKRGWKRFYLKWYKDPLPSAHELCPRSVELLGSIPTIRGAMFTLLPAGGKLGGHRDPYAGSLRYHLGLVTPNQDACRIYVDGEPHTWRDGEDVVFDETFIHRARNDTDRDRIILFADVERPMRNAPARWLNRAFARVVMGATQTKNLEGDGVGLLNRVFKYFYAMHLWTRTLKRRNRRLYRLGKHAMLAGVAVLVLFWL